MEFATELEVECTEGEVQLDGVIVDVAEGRAKHGEPMERNDP